MAKKYLDNLIFLIVFLGLFMRTVPVSMAENEIPSAFAGVSSFGYPSASSSAAGDDAGITVDASGETDKLSLDLRGIELTELFKVLSKKLNQNIIPSRNVIGRVNLFLNDIKYEDVLDIIMVSQGLAYERQTDNVLIVMTSSEYESLYGKKFDEKRKIRTLKISHAQPSTILSALNSLKSNVGELILDEVTGTLILIDIPEKLDLMENTFKDLNVPAVTEAFELQYAKVEEIEDDISSLGTEGSSSVLIDERTNTIIVTDLPGNMDVIRRTIAILDQETRQVYIEAEIIEITLSDDFAYGIQWEKIMNDPSFWGSALTGSFAGTGLTSAFTRLTLGTLDEHKFTATLNFLQSLGDTKILSQPRIFVTNNEEASIHVGRREAIVTGTTSQSGESTIVSDSVEFIDIGIKLTVVPTINRDGFVTIKIKPEVSSVSETITTGAEDEPRSIIPIITTSEAETTVKIKDGTMIMIAGLKQNDTRTSTDGVPY
ncbi:MAG: secretin N-terminal domain-containing protein, partial [Candidatus Omnitrophota bacterium]